MEVFKIEFKSHIRNGDNIIYTTIACVCFPYILSYFTKENAKSYFWISGVLFLIWVLPLICLHLNYYFVNKGYILMYDFENREITIKHEGRSNKFQLDDIDRVVRSVSFNLAANRAGFLPWDMYNHSVIYLKNGQKFIITSLLVPNLNIPIDSSRITIKQNFYRLAL